MSSKAINELRASKSPDPYPHKFQTSMAIPDFIEKYTYLERGEKLLEVEVAMAGRIMVKRDNKNLKFYDLHGEVSLSISLLIIGHKSPDYCADRLSQIRRRVENPRHPSSRGYRRRQRFSRPHKSQKQRGHKSGRIKHLCNRDNPPLSFAPFHPEFLLRSQEPGNAISSTLSRSHPQQLYSSEIPYSIANYFVFTSFYGYAWVH
jgi:hypothetical protein